MKYEKETKYLSAIEDRHRYCRKCGRNSGSLGKRIKIKTQHDIKDGEKYCKKCKSLTTFPAPFRISKEKLIAALDLFIDGKTTNECAEIASINPGTTKKIYRYLKLIVARERKKQIKKIFPSFKWPEKIYCKDNKYNPLIGLTEHKGQLYVLFKNHYSINTEVPPSSSGIKAIICHYDLCNQGFVSLRDCAIDIFVSNKKMKKFYANYFQLCSSKDFSTYQRPEDKDLELFFRRTEFIYNIKYSNKGTGIKDAKLYKKIMRTLLNLTIR